MADARSVAVIDIDGVLADVRHRLHHLDSRPKNWQGFFAAAPHDPILPEGLDLAWELADLYDIVYLTGRPEQCRDDTLHWLEVYQLPPGQLIMRSTTDRRPAAITKLVALQRLRELQEVALLVDDDDRVIEAAVAEGFAVHYATWMERVDGPDTSHRQQSLFEAQETEGRT